MKRLPYIFYIIIFLVLIQCSPKKADFSNTVNSVIGDISFIKKYGRRPDPIKDHEDLRLATHLEYVENILRIRKISHLPKELQEKRIKLLDLLKAYYTKAVFPKNYDFIERMPCFIDKDGQICAVGYLIEKTLGRDVAEEINNRHKYSKILEMNDPMVDEWIASSGLTKEECAMIQPNYSGMPNINRNYISPRYGISSAVLGGVNLSMAMLNAQQVTFGKGNKTVPYIGLATGTGSIIYGALNYQIYDTNNGVTTTNEAKKALSAINIGLGTTTAILSTWNLIVNKPGKRYSLNFYSFPDQKSYAGIGFNYRRSF